jgi:Ca2+-binding EF-hand superfamily protein
VRLRLTFQVPEITTYRLAVEACHARQTLANDIVEALGRLDRNGDGKVSSDEYRDAGAIISAATRLFEKLDPNDDGCLTADELETARTLPRNAAEALRLGRATAEAKTFRIKPFDKDADGTLDMDERKALTMAFVDASLRAAQDAAFYALVAESLSAARDLVAAKFTEVEIAP